MAKKTFPVSQFKEKCLSILNSLGPDGVIITKRGKPIARIESIGAGYRSKIGLLKGRLKLHGDISSTGIKWNAES